MYSIKTVAGDFWEMFDFSHAVFIFQTNFRMKSLLDHEIRCLILTSSTLTPFESFIAELGVPFRIKFTSKHVIEKHQKFAKILTHGFGNELLNSSFDHR